ncbi:hypothetical protein [Psychrobacter sp. I-STPA10]|uniref:hypothetical protein n=1 Tax=Psychrobacter sp. I-STPA10 TaxID=2585769 RepID=UPI001E512448|nr:hypothetical protein [Psychrobacter sp. I-STPA10]
MVEGIWWLIIILVVTIGLFLLALKKKPLQSNVLQPTKPPKKLVKLSEFIHRQFPEYEVNIRPQHLLLSNQGKKVAMLTMDNNLATGSRKLGEVMVINLHDIPNKVQLKELLSDVSG